MTPTKKVSDLNDTLILTTVSFLILLVLAFFGLKNSALIGKMDTATIVFSFDGIKNRVFSGQVVENMTILEVVLASAMGDDIKLSYHIDSKNNLILSSINTDINRELHGWNFYLNHNLVKTEDINKTYVKVGDLIEAKYQ